MKDRFMIGRAFIATDQVSFEPENSVENTIKAFQATGLMVAYTNGAFEWIRRPRRRSQSRLIKKMNHGRLSETNDGAVLLTVKIRYDEMVNIAATLKRETREAISAYMEFQKGTR